MAVAIALTTLSSGFALASDQSRGADRAAASLSAVAPSDAPDPPEPSPSPRAKPANAWEAALATVGADGSIPREVALDMFAMAIGPLPGVTPLSGPTIAIGEGTPAVMALLGWWDTLTPDQQAAARRALDPDRAPAASSVRSAQLALEGSGGLTEDQTLALATRLASDIGGRLGRPLQRRIEVVFSDVVPMGSGEVWAYTFPTAPDRTGTECMIIVRNAGQAFRGADFEGLIAHEVFHCFEFEIVSNSEETEMMRRSQWFMEGAAAWVGETIVGGSHDSVSWWAGWLEDPGRPLFSRVYDAIGFWSQLDSTAGPLWARLDGIEQAAAISNEVAFRVIAASSPAELMSSWGTSYFGDPTLGPAWAIEAPVPAGLRSTVDDEDVVPDTTVEREPLPYAADAFRVGLHAPIILVRSTASGMLRFADGDQDLRLADVDATALCTLANGCPCPEGHLPWPVRSISADMARVGLARASERGYVAFAGMSLDRACTAVAPTASDPCVVGTWTSTTVDLARTPGLRGSRGGAGALLTVKPDGTIRLEFDEMDHIVALSERETVLMKLFGTARGAAEIGEGEWRTRRLPLRRVTLVVTARAGGQRIQVYDGSLTAFTGPGGSLWPTRAARYTCTPGSLEIDPGAGGGIWRFTR